MSEGMSLPGKKQPEDARCGAAGDREGGCAVDGVVECELPKLNAERKGQIQEGN